MKRFGSVALFGRTNVGKSTFLNAVLGEELAVVSPLPETTRETLLGVVHRPDAQLAFIDTPGLHRPRSELGRRMNAAAIEVARSADVVVLLTDVDARAVANAERAVARDRDVIELLPSDKPTLLVLNKVDQVRDKRKLLPLLAAYEKAHEFSAIVPVSLRAKDGPARVLEAVVTLCPSGEAAYDDDVLTDRTTPYFVREYVREQVLAFAKGEVPHAVAVSIDAIERRNKVLAIKATIHVDKEGQRRILVGTGGAGVKRIGSGARLRLEALLGQKIFLELFIRVTPKWKHVPRQLTELGYDAPEDRSLSHALPDAPRRAGKRRRP